MTDNKWFKGNGFLSEDGERNLLDFRDALANIISTDDVRNMSVAEVHTLQANLAKQVGDAVSKHLSRRIQEAKALDEMSDKEVDAYLVDKYGQIWPQLTLSPEERIRVQSFKKRM